MAAMACSYDRRASSRAAFGLDHPTEAVERLPLLFDEAHARGAAERGLELARRFGQPPHAAKRLASVQERLHFSAPVRRLPRQRQRRVERVQRPLVVVQVQRVGDADVAPGADLAVAVLRRGRRAPAPAGMSPSP